MNLFEREELWKGFQKWKLDCYECAIIWNYFQRLGKMDLWERLYIDYIMTYEGIDAEFQLDYAEVRKQKLLDLAKINIDIQMIQFIHDELSIFPNKFIIIF